MQNQEYWMTENGPREIYEPPKTPEEGIPDNPILNSVKSVNNIRLHPWVEMDLALARMKESKLES